MPVRLCTFSRSLERPQIKKPTAHRQECLCYERLRGLRFWCHPERGRPVPANGGEGSAFRFGWTFGSGDCLRSGTTATADPSSRTPRDDTKFNSSARTAITHSQTRVQSIRIYARRRQRADAYAHSPQLLRGSAIGSTPAFGAGYPGSSPGPGAKFPPREDTNSRSLRAARVRNDTRSARQRRRRDPSSRTPRDDQVKRAAGARGGTQQQIPDPTFARWCWANMGHPRQEDGSANSGNVRARFQACR